jgi:hypothetical protein
VSANATIEIVEGSGGLIPPAITQQPRNQTVVEEQRATFKVKAHGLGSAQLPVEEKRTRIFLAPRGRVTSLRLPRCPTTALVFSVVVSKHRRQCDEPHGAIARYERDRRGQSAGPDLGFGTLPHSCARPATFSLPNPNGIRPESPARNRGTAAGSIRCRKETRAGSEVGRRLRS